MLYKKQSDIVDNVSYESAFFLNSECVSCGADLFTEGTLFSSLL